MISEFYTLLGYNWSKAWLVQPEKSTDYKLGCQGSVKVLEKFLTAYFYFCTYLTDKQQATGQ